MSISNLSSIYEPCTYDLKLDTCGQACPLPLLKTKQALSTLAKGQVLWVVSEQASLSLDIKVLLKQTGDALVREERLDELFHFFILKPVIPL